MPANSGVEEQNRKKRPETHLPAPQETGGQATGAQEAEARLIAQAKQNPQAFSSLYEQNVDRIYTYLYHRVQNVQDAEDLTARTFYQALEKLDSYEDRGLPFVAWLYRIAHNLLANWHRERGNRSILSLDEATMDAGSGDRPESRLESRERHSALWEAIHRLSADRRDLLIYKFSNRLSNAEIGKLMGRTEGAIKALYFRTLATLRDDLTSRGW